MRLARIAEPRVAAVAAALVVAGGLAVAGCAHRAPHEAPEAAPVPVAVTEVVASAGGAEIVVPGRVKARREAVLIAYASGRITDLPFEEGARFGSGAPLARFDAPEIRVALEAAARAVEAARVRGLAAARQEARIESLYAARVVATRDVELARSEARAAEAFAADAASALERARAAHVIVAPFDGVVVRRRADVGSRVAAGAPVLEVRSAGGVEIEAAVPESGLELARAGGATAQDEGGAWLPVRLARLEGATDAATRSRLAFFTPPAEWRAEPGAYARVRLAGAAAAGATDGGAIRVPAASVVRRGALTGVFVVHDGRARLRWIKPGDAAGAEIEVLAGLWPGEQFARDPRGLADGAAVRVAQAAP